MSTGVVRPKRGARGVRRYLADDWSPEAAPVNVFAVEHPQGVCLFDAGQTARAAEPGYFPRWHPFFRLSRFELAPDDEAAPQLARLGIDAAAVRWVVLSHLHTDHVGGIAAFSGADVLVTRDEWLRANGVAGRVRGYLPQRWPQGLAPTLIDLGDRPIGPFAGTYDVAGDGRLVVVPLPGHTPGHAGLLVRTDGRRLLLGGDAARSAEELAAIAPAVAAYCRAEGIVYLGSHDAEAASLAGA